MKKQRVQRRLGNKDRSFESLERREMLDAKGELLRLDAVRSEEVQITELIAQANLAKSSMNPDFYLASSGNFTRIVYGGNDGGTQNPNPPSPLDSPANRVDPNTAGNPFGGVVGVEVDDGLGVKYACSGAVVSPIHVLTAGHCFDNRPFVGGLPESDGNLDSGTTAQIRFNDGGDSTALINSSSIHLHPSYSVDNGNDDLAIVELANPVPTGTPIYDIRYEPMNNGDQLKFVGYGRAGWGDYGLPGSNPSGPDYYDGIDPTLPLEVKRSGENLAEFFLMDDDGGAFDEVYWFDFDGPAGTGFFGGGTLGNDVEASLGQGDSGSPAFFDNGGQLEIAGINSFTFEVGVPEGAYSSPTGGTSAAGGMILDAYEDWIEAIIDPAVADIQITTNPITLPGLPGSTTTTLLYVVTVENLGPLDANNVVINNSITIPAGVNILAQPTWMIPSLPANSSAIVAVTFSVDNSVNGTIDIMLSADGDEMDPDDNNDLIDESIILGAGGIQPDAVGFEIRSSSWTPAYDDHVLNEGANAVLPWVNLNTFTVTYDAPSVGSPPSFVLQGPTDGQSIPTVLSNWDQTTATYTFAGLTKGYYRASMAGKVVDFGVLPGDSTGNGLVDFFDFSALGPSFGQTGLGPDPHIADYTGNGQIDFFDFSVLGPAFFSDLSGFTPPSSPPPPPPPSAAVSATDAAFASVFEDDDDEEDLSNL